MGGDGGMNACGARDVCNEETRNAFAKSRSLMVSYFVSRPVIAAQPSAIPYLGALLPSELELQTLEETDSSEQDDQTDGENAAGNIMSVRCLQERRNCSNQDTFFCNSAIGNGSLGGQISPKR